MRPYLILYGCLFFIMTIGISCFTLDAEARRLNPEDIQKQMEEAGVNPEDGQTREEMIEALRNQRGAVEGGAGEAYASKSKSKNASDIKIPTGTQIMVKLDKELDSSETGEGEQFTGKLEADLVVDDFQLASRGGKVFGTITQSTRARNVAGTSVLEFMLVGIMIDNQMRSIESNHVRVESKKSGRLQASASIGTDQIIDFNIGEAGSGVENSGTKTLTGPDKKATDRVGERRNSRRERRD